MGEKLNNESGVQWIYNLKIKIKIRVVEIPERYQFQWIHWIWFNPILLKLNILKTEIDQTEDLKITWNLSRNVGCGETEIWKRYGGVINWIIWKVISHI